MTTPVNSIAEIFTLSPSCRERILAPQGPAGPAMGRACLSGIGLSSLGTGYQVGRNQRAYAVMLFTLAGAGVLTLPDRRVRLGPGSGVFLPLGDSHHYRTDGTWRIVWLHWAQGREELEGWPSPLARDGFAAERLESLVEIALDEAAAPGPSAPEVFAGAVGLLASLACQWMLPPSEIEGTAYAGVRRIVRAVESDPARAWTLDDLARIVHASAPTLARMTARATGLTPMDMVKRVRMRRAAWLLSTTDMPVYQIAGECGYANAFAFSRAFRVWHGESPTAWRTRHSGAG